MKKKILIFCSIIIIALLISGVSLFIYYNKHKIKEIEIDIDKLEITLVDNLNIEFLKDINVSDLISESTYNLNTDYKIDTTIIGEKVLPILLQIENIIYKTNITVNVIDVTAPLVWLNYNYYLTVGSNEDWYKNIICIDDYDEYPSCNVIGYFDIDRIGSYPLTFKAEDNSGNINEKAFILNIVYSTNSNNNKNTQTYLIDLISDYKNENTMIGMDISAWQGDVDFEKAKEDGIEFVFIRVGSEDKNGKFIDSKFYQNIEKAHEVNLPVGVYYYSYADSEEYALEDAKWVYDIIKDFDIELGVVFDWEDFKKINNYHLSLYRLNKIADIYLNFFDNLGYTTYQYGSINYLENFWIYNTHNTWLAHYNSTTSYEKDYEYWQICDDGIVDGINGFVDLDIRYIKKEITD